MEEIPVVILCGGKGSRIHAEFPDIPKPLIRIGERCILERVIDIYLSAGCKEIYLCLGHKAEEFIKYFAKPSLIAQFQESGYLDIPYLHQSALPIKLHLIHTGEDTPSAGRLKKIQTYLSKHKQFFLTYADGLSDINIRKLLQHHQTMGKIATLTAVQPILNFGILDIQDNVVSSFREKPQSKEWINGGFFVFSQEIFDEIYEQDTLEIETVDLLIQKKELTAYLHQGIWMCMDTYKDYLRILRYFDLN